MISFDKVLSLQSVCIPEWDVSAIKCEMCFPLECHQSEKVRTAVVKRVGARSVRAFVPGSSSHAVISGIHDGYIVFLCFVPSSSKILAVVEAHWPLTLRMTAKTTFFVGDKILTVFNLCTHDIQPDVDIHILQ